MKLKEFKKIVKEEIKKTKSKKKKEELSKFIGVMEWIAEGNELLVPKKKDHKKIVSELRKKYKLPKYVIDNVKVG